MLTEKLLVVPPACYVEQCLNKNEITILSKNKMELGF